MRRKYFKNGDPLHYTYFNDETFKSMNPVERSRWMPSDDSEDAEIPDEVVDFTKGKLEKTGDMIEFKEKIYDIKELSKLKKADLLLTYSKITKGKKLEEDEVTRKQIIDEILKFQGNANN